VKLRITPILLTVAASALILFGGWVLYNQFAVEAPLQKAVNQISGIASADAPKMDKERVALRVTLEPNANLKAVYDSINKQGKSSIGNRELQLSIDNATSSERLEKLWSTVLFTVAESMETKRYSDIPVAMDKLAQTNSGIKVVTEMDQTNVYVTIKDETSSKYVVLPRTPAMLEVSAHA